MPSSSPCMCCAAGHVSTAVLEAARSRTVTPATVGGLANPSCDLSFHHLSVLDAPARDALVQGLPWALRDNPERYPFLRPPPGTPACTMSANGKQCSWSGSGPSSVMDPRCQAQYSGVPY